MQRIKVKKWDSSTYFYKPKLIQILKNTRGLISCIHAATVQVDKTPNTYLYVGTTLGTIKLYTVVKKTTEIGVEYVAYEEATFDAENEIKTLKNIQDKAILSIQTDNVFRIAFVLFNDRVHMLNMDTLEYKGEVPDTKGASMFALDKMFTVRQSPMDKGIHRLAVVIKKKALINIYIYSEKEKPKMRPAGPIKTLFECICVEFVQDHLIFAAENLETYVCIHLKQDDGDPNEPDKKVEVKDIWGTMKSRRVVPQILHIEKELVLLKYGDIAEVARSNGRRYYKKSSSGKAFKYAKCIFKGEPASMAICFPYVAALLKSERMIEVCNLYDDVNLKDAYLSTKSESVPCKDGKFICGCPERIFVATEKIVQILWLPPVEELSKALASDQLTRQSSHLLGKKYDEGDIEKVKVNIKMQETAGFSNLFGANFEEAFKCFYHARELAIRNNLPHMDVREILGWFLLNFKDPLYQDKPLLHEDFMATYEMKRKKGDIDNLRKKLMKHIEKLQAEKKTIVLPVEKLVNIWLLKAENNLLTFLNLIRAPADKPLSKKEQEEQSVIDYALLVLWLKRINADPKAYPSIEQIVSGPNYCKVEPESRVYIDLLSQKKCHRFIALLWRSKGEYRQALRKLRDHVAKGEEPGQDGVNETVDILCKSNDFDLIKEYSDWVMDADPSRGIKIFITDRGEHNPPPNEVLRFLQKYPEDVTQQYLNYLINNAGNKLEEYHTRYAEIMIDNIMRIKPKKFKLPTGLRVPAGKESGLVGQYRRDLLHHLAHGNYKTSEIIAKLRQTDSLYEELTVAYTKVKNYKDAIKVFLINLKDKFAAEDYCDHVFKTHIQQEAETTGVAANINPLFIMYLEICFGAHRNSKTGNVTFDEVQDPTMVKWALELLNSRAADIDPVEALAIIPPNIPIRAIEQFLQQATQLTHQRYRRAKVLASISETANLDVHGRHKRATQRNVTVYAQTVCNTCRDPIGDAVFAVFPDLTMCHYRCLKTDPKKKVKMTHIHPKTKHNFSKLPYPLD